MLWPFAVAPSVVFRYRLHGCCLLLKSIRGFYQRTIFPKAASLDKLYKILFLQAHYCHHHRAVVTVDILPRRAFYSCVKNIVLRIDDPIRH